MDRKANLFLVGAAKAGTTSLFSYFNQHPQIFFSPLKEPNFFAKDIDSKLFSKAYKKRNDFIKPDYFEHRPLPQHHISFIKDIEQYQLLFKDAGNESYLGDASTSYLYSEVAAKEIKQYNEHARIIVILRNPIERAYSHYKMAMQGGYTSLPFIDAIKKDQASTQKGFGISELFIELGLYEQQLERYYNEFPFSQIKVMLYDDLNANTNAVLNDVFDWLNLEKAPVNVDEQKNISRQPKSKKWNKILADKG
ncbi:MAG: sulfotransferase, partial [Bacteroidia bacterium]|nr:sulfotransferase [Bacteroidia bacterium]